MNFQKGFSLVELGVTVGLMGAVSLLTMRIMENQSAAQMSVEAAAEINTTVSLIAQAINDPQKCNSMFVGRNVNSVVTELRYQVINPPSTVTLLESRNAGKIYQYFYIDDGDMTLSQDIANIGMANLNILFNVQSMAASQKINLFSQINSRTVRRQIPFNVITDGAMNIISCGPLASRSDVVARETACRSLQNTGILEWNPVTLRCQLKTEICPYGSIAINFNASGVVCGRARDHIPVENIFDLNHVTNNCAGAAGNRVRWGVVAHPTTGKLQIECTHY